ncbi:MAG: AbrB/MazE/SpoVT family DNA-binding domain-containing protein [Gemmatimonadales bacterium]
MKKPSQQAVAYSRISVKSQTVLPRLVRDALAVRPGDTVRYRLTDRGVVLEKAAPDGDDPFTAFTEWSGEHDSRSYDDL